MPPKGKKFAVNVETSCVDPFDVPTAELFHQYENLTVPLFYNEAVPFFLHDKPAVLPVHAWGVVRGTNPHDRGDKALQRYLIIQYADIQSEGIRREGKEVIGFRDLNDPAVISEVKEAKGVVVQVIGSLLGTLHYNKEDHTFSIPVLAHPSTIRNVSSHFPQDTYAADIQYSYLGLNESKPRRAYEYKPDVFSVQHLSKKHVELTRIPVLKLHASR